MCIVMEFPPVAAFPDDDDVDMLPEVTPRPQDDADPHPGSGLVHFDIDPQNGKLVQKKKN